MDLTSLTLKATAEGVKDKKWKSEEVVSAYLAKIDERNPTTNAFLEVFENASADAKAMDKRISEGFQGSLAGVPIAVKDNILIKGNRVSAASKILENYISPYDATVIHKLRESGAIFIGRTNMDEFAMGGSNENSAFGPVRNPHDESRVSGGSSGGSAAAVAMNAAAGALGSDTGGSVRQPSSYCGVVGLKPTYGSVSRYGLIAMGSSLDQIGPITKTVEDSKILFDIIRGRDSFDSSSIDLNPMNTSGNKKLTIGVPRKFLQEGGINAEVSENFESSIQKMKDSGIEVKDIDLPNAKYALPIYYIIMPAEAASNLARFDGVKYGSRVEGSDLLQMYLNTRSDGFGKEVKRRIFTGNYILSAGYYDAYYKKAVGLRKLIRADFTEAYKQVDVIAMPTAPTPAFRLGEKNSDPISMYLEDIFTVTANLCGVPAISVPSGFTAKTEKPLPLGIQFIAPWSEEERLFQMGQIFERLNTKNI